MLFGGHGVRRAALLHPGQIRQNQTDQLGVVACHDVDVLAVLDMQRRQRPIGLVLSNARTGQHEVDAAALGAIDRAALEAHELGAALALGE